MTSLHRLIAIVTLVAASGCPSEESPIEEFCVRLDECNNLTGSVRGCVEKMEKAADDLPDSERADFNNLLDRCLDLNSCDLFVSCVASIFE